MVESERLALVPISPRVLDALVEGRRDDAEREAGVTLPADWPSRHDEGFLRFRRMQLERGDTTAEWLPQLVALREARRPVVGHVNFHGPPGVNAPGHPDAVEIGYAIFPPFQGRGYATEAVRTLVGWLHEERGVDHVVASIGPGNAPSLALARRLGFVETGRHWDDEDGEEVEFELRLGTR